MGDNQNEAQNQANTSNPTNTTAGSANNKIIQYQDHVVTDETQQMLNQPLKYENGIDEKDAQFLRTLMEKVDKGEINLYRPSSLFNLPVYEKLNGAAQAKADIDAFNLLATIREIYQLWKQGNHDTYQIANLAHRIRVTKERLEELGGDIFII